MGQRSPSATLMCLLIGGCAPVSPRAPSVGPERNISDRGLPGSSRTSSTQQPSRISQLNERADAAEAEAAKLEGSGDGPVDNGELSAVEGTGTFSGLVLNIPGQVTEIFLCSVDFTVHTSLDYVPGPELRSGDYVQGRGRLVIGTSLPLQRQLTVLSISVQDQSRNCPASSKRARSLNLQRAAELRDEARRLRDEATRLKRGK